MTGSWDVLSAGKMEFSPGKQQLTRGLEGWRGEGAEERGLQGRPQVAAILCQGSARPRRRAVWPQGCCGHRSDPVSPQHERRAPPGMAAGRGSSTGAALRHRAPLRRVLAEPRVQTGAGSAPGMVTGAAGPSAADCDEGGTGDDGPGCGAPGQERCRGHGGDGAGDRRTHPGEQHQPLATNTGVPSTLLGGGGRSSAGASKGWAGTGKRRGRKST